MKAIFQIEIKLDEDLVTPGEVLKVVKQSLENLDVPRTSVINVTQQQINSQNTLADLKRSHVKEGTLVKIKVPANHRLYKFNGRKGKIIDLSVDINPYPIIQLEQTGEKLAVELKHLIYPKQSSLF